MYFRLLFSNDLFLCFTTNSFVDAIHTDICLLGSKERNGHLDFYV